MKKIALTGNNGRGKFALVDDGDYEKVNKYKWYLSSRGYVVRTRVVAEGKGSMRIHRFLMNCPVNKMVNYKDMDTLNNQKSNLRLCTRAQNSYTRGLQKSNTSGYKGVTWSKQSKKWRAVIEYQKKKIHLGVFEKIEDARDAYNSAASKYHGEFAWLNNA